MGNKPPVTSSAVANTETLLISSEATVVNTDTRQNRGAAAVVNTKTLLISSEATVINAKTQSKPRAQPQWPTQKRY